jgi:hypothetical protein
MGHLAWVYGNMDRFVDSMALSRELRALRKSTTGPSSWETRNFAEVCLWAGKLDEAEPLLREVLEQERKQTDSEQQRRNIGNAAGLLALALVLRERYDEAEPLAREAVASFEGVRPGGPTAGRSFYWKSLLGAVFSGQQKYPKAEALLLQGYQGMEVVEALHPAVRRRLTEVGRWIVRLYEATNQPEKARVWREKLKARIK